MSSSRSADEQDPGDPQAARPPDPAHGRRARSVADAARLARVFGETLPQTSSDERATDGELPRSSDDWLRSQVPPHHG